MFPPGSICTRCREVIVPGSVCFVPHPNHLLQQGGSSYGRDGSSWDFYCSACRSSFTRSTSTNGSIIDSVPITRGKRWCFEGEHTIKPLRPDFQSRVWEDVVVLNSSDKDLESKIKALDGNANIRVLKIKSSDGMYDTKIKVQIKGIRMPSLEEFQSEDVNLTELELTQKTTPKLHTIFIQNMPDEVKCNIECPELKKCSIHYWGPGDERWVHKMLKFATKLEAFDSYKFRVGYLVFASNHLETIRLHRAECMSNLQLWAPNLIRLDLQACYDLDSITFLENHPLKKDLPKNFSCSEPLSLNVENACLGPKAVEALSNHPRVNSQELSEELQRQEDMLW
jgi:hypothetical protein